MKRTRRSERGQIEEVEEEKNDPYPSQIDASAQAPNDTLTPSWQRRKQTRELPPARRGQLCVPPFFNACLSLFVDFFLFLSLFLLVVKSYGFSMCDNQDCDEC